jgi:hypothetical protein
LQKIKNFYDQGGVVIATSVLPDHAAEIGKDEEVQTLVKSIFGEDAYHTANLTRVTASGNWNTGGFLPSSVLDGRLETSWKPSEGNMKEEWLEIYFGGERTLSQVKIGGNEDAVFSFKVLYHKDNKWIEGGKWVGSGKEKTVQIKAVSTSGIRIVLESGEPNKVSISELEILDQQSRNIVSENKTYTFHANSHGGKAWFVPAPNSAILKTILDETGHTWDVRFEKDYPVTGGNLSYLHKRINGKDVWFFANSSDNNVDVPVIIKGKHKLQTWNPQNGQISECESTIISQAGINFTRVQLKLDPVQSVFILPE